MKWYGKKLVVVKDDKNLMEELSKFAIAIEDKRQGDDEHGRTECNLAVHNIVENLSGDDGQNTELNLNNRNNITDTENEETIPESGHKTTNSQCCCNELAVQVKRIEGDIELKRVEWISVKQAKMSSDVALSHVQVKRIA